MKLPLRPSVGQVLFGAGMLGLVLIFIGSGWNVGALMAHIGVALFVAFILGFTIDTWVKGKIVRDVFDAALGYVLPPIFRSEVQRVIGFKFICEDHLMRMTLVRVGADEVRITTKMTRKLKNITSNPEEMFTYITVDEWGFAEKSSIQTCIITDETRKQDEATLTVDKGNCTIERRTVPFKVPPGATVTCTVEASEIRRVNDHIIFKCGTPTTKPRVTIDAPTDLLVECGFGGDDEKIISEQHGQVITLDGTYFPPALIRVRWYPKAAA